MRCFLVLLGLSAFVLYVQAGIAIESPNPNIKHDGYCYASSGKLGELAKGEEKQLPGKCEIARCRDDHSVQYNICAPFQVRLPCTISDEDPSKPWPDCCPQPICPERPKPKTAW